MKQALCLEGVDPRRDIGGGVRIPGSLLSAFTALPLCLVPGVSGGGRGR